MGKKIIQCRHPKHLWPQWWEWLKFKGLEEVYGFSQVPTSILHGSIMYMKIAIRAILVINGFSRKSFSHSIFTDDLCH